MIWGMIAERFLMALIVAGGISVRDPKVDSVEVFDWLVHGRIENHYLSVEAEEERENGLRYTNGEANGQIKYARVSVIENSAKQISRQEATLKLPWRSKEGLAQAEIGASVVWYDWVSRGTPTGYFSLRIGNDTLRASVRGFPDFAGVAWESIQGEIEARASLLSGLNAFWKARATGVRNEFNALSWWRQSQVGIEYRFRGEE